MKLKLIFWRRWSGRGEADLKQPARYTMAKRGASSNLNQDNWDADDDNEEPGTFARVSENELKNRIIRKAKRSLNSSSSSTDGKSPFAAFGGFGGKSSPFTFIKKSESVDSGQSPLLKKTENSVQKENGKSSDAIENKISKISDSSTKKATRDIEYYKQLQSLNESVLQWMQLHLAKNVCCDFTPVFNDYKKHMDSLNVTYPVENNKTSLSEVKKNDFFKKPAAGGDSSNQEKEINNKNSNAGSDFKLEKSKSEDETDYGAHFSSNTTYTSTFSFGMKSGLTATSSVSPMGPASSSKEEEKVPEKKPFQFTFGSTPKSNDTGASTGFSFASAIAAKSAEKTDDTEEKEYEPPKNDFVPVSEEDALYSIRCKLFFKKGEAYADKGVGTLYLKSIEGKTQLLVRADTSLGNILLNIMLSASLPMSRTGKNNVLLVCVPNPPLDAKNADSKEAIPMLIRVKTDKDADELLEVLNKYKS